MSSVLVERQRFFRTYNDMFEDTVSTVVRRLHYVLPCITAQAQKRRGMKISMITVTVNENYPHRSVINVELKWCESRDIRT